MSMSNELMFCRNDKETGLSELLSVTELSEYLRISVNTIYRWRVQGTGPRAARMGKHLRWRRAEVERWLREREEREAAGRAG
jgi:excisionase family DNA binding protein